MAEDYPVAPALFLYRPPGLAGSRTAESDRALNLAGAQAAGANVNMLRSSVYHSLNALDIGLEGAVGTNVRVRHGDAEIDALAAELALCHNDTS